LLTKAPRGTRDILFDEATKWVYLESEFRKICGDFGYDEIRTPIFEHTELFQRGVGETTDIVEKEMYTFYDKGNRSITLKPEGTASVVRAYLEHNMYALPQPVKLYYIIPGFRYERPQAGRLREFHQFGVEAFGTADADMDAEIISLSMMFLERLGLKNLELRINSIGCPNCRKTYRQVLTTFLKDRQVNLCNTCKIRLDKNPLRVLDCKDKNCKNTVKDAPMLLDHLCEECLIHFEKLKNRLDQLNLDYKVDPTIVRGLDYYTRTVFEVLSGELGAQNTLCGGGRYDGLVEECGGNPTPGIGFAMGIERLLLTMTGQGITFPRKPSLSVFIVTVGDEASSEGFKLLTELRKSGISADKDYLSRSLKSQMKHAGKFNANYTVIIGEEEIKTGVFTVKNMFSGEQLKLSKNQLIKTLKQGQGEEA
jgi:histidyl-tRNA synthetase